MKRNPQRMTLRPSRKMSESADSRKWTGGLFQTNLPFERGCAHCADPSSQAQRAPSILRSRKDVLDIESGDASVIDHHIALTEHGLDVEAVT